MLFEKSESNVLKKVCDDSDEIDGLSLLHEKSSEKLFGINCGLSETLRKTCVNDETYDAKDSSSHCNYLFNAIKQSDTAMEACRKHHKLMNYSENLKNDIRKFSSECYEKSAPDSLNANIIYSFEEFQIPNSSKLSAPSKSIKHMKQDRNWVPSDLVLPILALEWHVDL